MTSVYERVDAMWSATTLWPEHPSPGSGFANDEATNPAVSPYLATRIQLLEAIRLLRRAADLSREPDALDSSAHLLLLRPALVLTAKAAWVSRPDTSEDRVARAVRLVISEQDAGARAMDGAVDQGGPAAFGALGDRFRSERTRLAATLDSYARPPGDEALIRELSTDVDRYYGSSDTSIDMQVLWNGSSSLAHGERWFRVLTSRRRGHELAEMVTRRSLDAICSGINVTSLRLVMLVASPPVLPPSGSLR